MRHLSYPVVEQSSDPVANGNYEPDPNRGQDRMQHLWRAPVDGTGATMAHAATSLSSGAAPVNRSSLNTIGIRAALHSVNHFSTLDNPAAATSHLRCPIRRL